MARGLIFLLDAYKRWISPMLPRACRFSPSCSEYSKIAVLKYGPLRGGRLSLFRLLRCQPFSQGGIDLP